MKLLLLIILTPLFCFAAPHPATSTSALTNPETGFYFLHKGFSLRSIGTNWVPLTSDDDSLLNAVRLGSKDPTSHGVLSVRAEKVTPSASLELYTRKWMRDYPSYGFEVLSAKHFTLNAQPALVVDMLSRSKNKQIRQVILKKNGTVAIMTCLDDRNTFSKTLQSCNTIIKSFSWNEDPMINLKK